MEYRNYEEDDKGHMHVVRGWVEDGINLTLFGNHGPMISIKFEDDAWDGDQDVVPVGLFDKYGLPVHSGPYDDRLDEGLDT